MMKQTRRYGKPPQESASYPSERDTPLTPCDRASEWEALFYDYAEGLCDSETCAALEQHLASCAYCRQALREIRRMTEALRVSVPAPPPQLHARVMQAVTEEGRGQGRVITETVDVRTGRVIGGDRFSLRRITRIFGGAAAAFVLVVGLVLLLPMMRGGDASAAPEILEELQEGERVTFSDGVFIGLDTQAVQETEANGFGVIPGVREPGETSAELEPRYPVVITVSGTDSEHVRSLLSALSPAGGAAVVMTEEEDGILVSPLSVYKTAVSLLTAAELSVSVSEEQASDEDNTLEDAFYIQIREP